MRLASFVALYSGRSIQEATLIAVSTHPALVAHVATAILQAPEPAPVDDLAVEAVQAGRRCALNVVRREAAGLSREMGPARLRAPDPRRDPSSGHGEGTR